MKRIREWWWRIIGWWRVRRLLVNPEQRKDAQEAVNKVVYETHMPPDCVTAGVMRGGPSIQVKHNDAWEVFIHRTYREAADEAIMWVNLQGSELSYNKTTKMPRRDRRAFDSFRRKRG